MGDRKCWTLTGFFVLEEHQCARHRVNVLGQIPQRGKIRPVSAGPERVERLHHLCTSSVWQTRGPQTHTLRQCVLDIHILHRRLRVNKTPVASWDRIWPIC